MIAHAHEGNGFSRLPALRINDLHRHSALFNCRPVLRIGEHDHEVKILLLAHLCHHGADIIEMGHALDTIDRFLAQHDGFGAHCRHGAMVALLLPHLHSAMIGMGLGPGNGGQSEQGKYGTSNKSAFHR